MTTGWVRFRHEVFQGWDQAQANENFPRHSGGALVLDGIGYCEQLLSEEPEKILEMSRLDGDSHAVLPGQPGPLERAFNRTGPDPGQNLSLQRPTTLR